MNQLNIYDRICIMYFIHLSLVCQKICVLEQYNSIVILSLSQKEEICIYVFILFIGLLGLNMIKARSF